MTDAAVSAKSTLPAMCWVAWGSILPGQAREKQHEAQTLVLDMLGYNKPGMINVSKRVIQAVIK